MYYAEKMRQAHRLYGWVNVPHPFSLTDLCRRLLLDFHSDDADAKETALIRMMEGQNPVQEFCKILRENKCVLFIDDLRSKHEWDLIKSTLLSQSNIGVRVIVITREESIARHCTNTEHDILNINGLKDDAALDLFNQVTLKGKFRPELEVTSNLIMSKCGGIPEVIVAIRKAARINRMEIEHLESTNVRFMEILVEASSSSSSLKRLFCWMKSYFDACSDELLPCIFYMSVLPAGQSIRQSRLIRRWIAEGYSSGGGGAAAAEEKGKELICELMKLSILYYDQETSTTSYKANGFFREYINSQPLEDNLVFALEGSCSANSRLTGQHLTISSCWDRDEIVFKSMDLSRLRSLTVFGKWVPFLISDKMKVLRVLDLEGTSSTSDGTASVTDDVLEKIVKQFPRLKFMSLRGCMEVTRLPDSLGAMSQLETLDARHTSIVELPPAVITKLHKLQYIRAGTTKARLLQAAATMPPPSSPPKITATPLPSPPTPPTGTPPPPATQEEDIHSGTSPFLGANAAELCTVQRTSTKITRAWKRMAHALVKSSSSSSWWESKKQRRRRVRVAANGGGVEVVPAAVEGIGKLTELHTLGVVNIAGRKGGHVLLKELKNLTQLRKLGLSGINREKWKDLCSAISGHLPHLESLSLQLQLLEGYSDYDFAIFDDISRPPKTLKSLKVFYTSIGGGAGAGAAWITPAWINQFPNLKRFNHEVRISSQDDINNIQKLQYFTNEPHVPRFERRLGIKSVQQHVSLVTQHSLVLDSLAIYCSGINSSLTIGSLWVTTALVVKAVSIHCCSSCGGSSCLRIDGLQSIRYLKEVFVMGPCSSSFKEDLQKQLDKHQDKPVLKLL